MHTCVRKYPSVPMTPGNFGRRQILGNSNRARSSCVPLIYTLERRWSGSDTCCDYIIIILFYAALYTHTLETACTKYYNIIMFIRAPLRDGAWHGIRSSRQKRLRNIVRIVCKRRLKNETSKSIDSFPNIYK